MKKSRYNVVFEHNDKKFAFNGMACALAEVTDDFLNIINSIENLDIASLNKEKKELFDAMKDGNYIIDDNTDELSILKFRSYYGKFSDRTLSLTILPNLQCNFACPYCYEGLQVMSGKSKVVHMKNDVKEAIYKQVEFAAEAKTKLGVSWYGGEPTLSKDIIVEMSDKMISICKKHDVKYVASMTSNGFLIDDEFINKMINAKIETVQITVDGPPAIHNSTRKLKNGSGTFDAIIKNIKKMKDNGITVYIRMNITKLNMHSFTDLLDILMNENLNDCQVIPSSVVPYQNVGSCVANNCLSAKEFSKKDLEYRKILYERGFIESKYPHIPNYMQNYCYGDNVASYSIDPSGNIYKCWIDVGNSLRSLGNIKEITEKRLETIAEKALHYMFWSPFKHQKCNDCEILPLCMGGCPHRGMLNNNTPNCDLLKYNLIDGLKMLCGRQSSEE